MRISDWSSDVCSSDLRLRGGLVVVVLKIDGVLVDVLQQGVAGGTRQPRLGVAHGRRRIAVHGAEVALAVDQRQAHGEVLRSEEHTSELQSLMRISYHVFCLKKKT